MKKDKKLENILRSVEVDRASDTFNDDVMDIIMKGDTAYQFTELKEFELKIDRAPMHMTDLVLHEIASKKQKNSHTILSSSDIKIGFVLLALVFIPTLIACIRYKGLPALSISSGLQQLIYNIFLIAICSTLLWVVDRRLRPST